MNSRHFNIKVFTSLVLSGLILTLLITCEKPERVVEFTTIEAQAGDISYTTATLKGEITDAGSKPMEDHGILVSSDPNPRVGNATVKSLGSRTTKGIFSVNVTELTTNTTYYFRSYVTIEGVDTYADKICNFKTKDYAPPTVTTGAATSVTATSATLEGTVNANDLSTAVTFEYGLTTSYGTEVSAKQSPVTGTTATSVSAGITGLDAGTTYHYRTKAVSTGGTTYGDDMEFITLSLFPTVSDYDDNEYNIITIGTQDWIQEDLKTTHYSNGDEIPNITDNTAWWESTSGAYSWYNNDPATYKDTYGALYNWYTTVDVRNICPIGWHVPTDSEWTTLTNYLGGESVAGGKLKETGTSHWVSPNNDATNETGFTALPGGTRFGTGEFYVIGEDGNWWSSTEYSSTYAWYRYMNYDLSGVYSYNNYKTNGFSVRCVKGELPLTQTETETSVSSTTATLNGIVNPNGTSTTVSFEYGKTTSYGSSVDAIQSPVSGSIPVNVSADLTSLTPGTTYHCRIKAMSSGGTTYGEDIIFTTLSLPVATTESATAVASTSATLNGTVNANDLSTTVTFEYGLTTSYGTEVTADESPVTGSTSTAVSAGVTGLSEGTTYHFRVRAVSTGGTSYGDDASFTTNATLPTVSDYDGNNYNIITIGTQDWIQENLKTTHYNNGDIIANITDNTEWEALTTAAYCWYDNDEGTYKDIYGALYNWYTTVDVRNVCPAGWHVASDAEWTTLTTYLGGESVAGGKLKETGITHWTSPNTGATNETGFTTLPGGYRSSNGTFDLIGEYGYWWSSTEYSAPNAWYRLLGYDSGHTGRYNFNKKSGYSVRCVKD